VVRRHRVQRPGAADGQFYTVDDLNIGNTLTIYSRQFHLVNCDQFTANFLTKLGVLLNPPQHIPADPYTQQRQMVPLPTDCCHFVCSDSPRVAAEHEPFSRIGQMAPVCTSRSITLILWRMQVNSLNGISIGSVVLQGSRS